jgi:hypothetical protein
VQINTFYKKSFNILHQSWAQQLTLSIHIASREIGAHVNSSRQLCREI